MVELIQKYGGPAAFKKLIETFYARIKSERGLMHYFFSVPLAQVIADQLAYPAFVIRKTDIDYRQDISQTGTADVRISHRVFEDVVKVLFIVLADAKVHRLDAPRMAMHIIELVEETRSQIADTKQTFYKPVDITTDALLKFYRSQSIESKLNEASGEIESLAMYGLAYPLNTRVDHESQTVCLFARAYGREDTEVFDVHPVVMAASMHFPGLTFRTYRDDVGLVIYEASYQISTAMGVPKRLLQRVTTNFTWRFEESFKLDEQEVLINVVAPDKNKALLGYD